jgi:hypothetical protein
MLEVGIDSGTTNSTFAVYDCESVGYLQLEEAAGGAVFSSLGSARSTLLVPFRCVQGIQ